MYAFNCTHKDPVLAELFSDPQWSEAMSLALNRDEINATLNFGLSQPVQALPVHPTRVVCQARSGTRTRSSTTRPRPTPCSTIWA